MSRHLARVQCKRASLRKLRNALLLLSQARSLDGKFFPSIFYRLASPVPEADKINVRLPLLNPESHCRLVETKVSDGWITEWQAQVSLLVTIRFVGLYLLLLPLLCLWAPPAGGVNRPAALANLAPMWQPDQRVLFRNFAAHFARVQLHHVAQSCGGRGMKSLLVMKLIGCRRRRRRY